MKQFVRARPIECTDKEFNMEDGTRTWRTCPRGPLVPRVIMAKFDAESSPASMAKFETERSHGPD